MHLREFLTDEIVNHSKENITVRERRIAGFLSRGGAGGALGAFVWIMYLIFVGKGPFVTVLLLALLPYMVMAGIAGVIVGGFILISRSFMGREIKIPVGGLMGAMAMTSMVAVIRVIIEKPKWDPDEFLGATLIGLTAGLLAASKTRLWRALAVGRSVPDKIVATSPDYQKTGRAGRRMNSSLMGLGLRIGSIFMIMESILLLECWLVFDLEVGLAQILFGILYFSASAFAAFEVRLLPIAPMVSIVINLPWLLLLFARPEQAPFLAVLALTFILFWLLFLLGNACAFRVYRIGGLPRIGRQRTAITIANRSHT